MNQEPPSEDNGTLPTSNGRGFCVAFCLLLCV